MPSKKAKDRKHTRKRAHSELNARRTEASRKRRLTNKAKREEIHAVNPDVKITMVDGVPRDPDGKEIELINGIYTLVEPEELDDDIIKATIKFCQEPYDAVPIMEADGPRYIERDSNGKIIESSTPQSTYEDAVVEYQEVMDKEPPKSAFSRLKDKIRGI